MNKHNILIAIIAYNEEKNIGNLLQKLKVLEISTNVQIVVFDDCSSDKTCEIATNLKIKVSSSNINLGYAKTCKRACKFCLENNYDAILYCDGDGQHHVDDVKTFLKAATSNRTDIILSNRFAHKYRMGTLRRIGSFWIKILTALVIHHIIHDPTNGMRMICNKKLINVIANHSTATLEQPTINIFISLNYSWREIKTTVHQRSTGKSMFTPLTSIKYMILATIAIIFRHWFQKKAIKKFIAKDKHFNKTG